MQTIPKRNFLFQLLEMHYIHEKKGKIKVIPTSAQWFGVTYREDAPAVKQNIESLIEKGEYPESCGIK